MPSFMTFARLPATEQWLIFCDHSTGIHYKLIANCNPWHDNGIHSHETTFNNLCVKPAGEACKVMSQNCDT